MLAPMAGYSDRPFREIVREWGADYAVAEMTASREDLRCRAKSLTRWVERDEPGAARRAASWRRSCCYG